MDAQQLVSSCWFDDLLFHDWPDVSLRLQKGGFHFYFSSCVIQKVTGILPSRHKSGRRSTQPVKMHPIHLAENLMFFALLGLYLEKNV